MVREFRAPVSSSMVDGEFMLVPEDDYPGQIVGVVGLGTHVDATSIFKNKDGSPKKRALLGLFIELPGVQRDDGCGTAVVGQQFTLSLNERSKLRPVYESVVRRLAADEDNADLTALLGKPCKVSIVHATSK